MCINEDFVAQGDAGQKGAGQTGPEGPGGDSGEFTRLVTDSVDFMVWMYYLLFSVHSKKQKQNITVGRKKNPHRLHFLLLLMICFFCILDNCVFFLSFKGQGAADPPQPEEAFRSGLGNQSEKGEPARFSSFIYVQKKVVP